MTMHLECLDCGTNGSATVKKIHCDSCGGLFKLAYDQPSERSQPRTPLAELERVVSLGEGNTPLVSLERTARRLGIEQLWAKLEFIAPTGSFKDRGTAVLISAALSENVTEFVEDSSGNAGASLSAYAAAAGIKAHVFAPSSAASGKLDQIRIFGAELHAIDGPRQTATDAAERYVAEQGLPYLSHNLSAYFSEGMKAVAYEISQGPAANVQHIILPVGNGSMLIGAKAGFDELREANAIVDAPRFHGVQADGVQPVAAAVNGNDWSQSSLKATVASGIAVSSPPRLNQCVDAIRDSGGCAVVVDDSSALDWQRRLAADEGLFCEATSATAFAGLEQLIATGTISSTDSVLIPITGSGLKEPVRQV
jgi:threonine synthase